MMALTLYCDDGMIYTSMVQVDTEDAVEWFERWLGERDEVLYLLGVIRVRLHSKSKDLQRVRAINQEEDINV